MKLAADAPQLPGVLQHPGVALPLSAHVWLLHAAFWQALVVQLPTVLQQPAAPVEVKPHTPALHFGASHAKALDGQSASAQHAAHVPLAGQYFVPAAQHVLWSQVSVALQSLVSSQQPATGLPPPVFFDVYVQEKPVVPLNARPGQVTAFWQAFEAAQPAVDGDAQQPAAFDAACTQSPPPMAPAPTHVSLVHGSPSSQSESRAQQPMPLPLGTQRLPPVQRLA